MNESEAQEPVFALLADPATHGGAAVKRIDTHAASVFLAGRARLQGQARGALSVPRLFDAREAQGRLRGRARGQPAVRAEIYRRVVPITREPDGRLALDGDGTPVEWAVEMRRFDESATLDHLAEAGRIDAALADALGRAVAAAHATRARSRAGPWIAALADYIDEHVEAFGETPGSVSAAEASMRSRVRAAPPTRAFIRCCSSAGARASSAASTATCISAISS